MNARRIVGSALLLSLFAINGAILGACSERADREDPSDDDVVEVTEPDARLETDAWPVWVPAMQVPRCREEAVALRDLVDRASADPVLSHQARRRIAELTVCLDRHRPELDTGTDPVWKVELAIAAAPELRALLETSREALLACAGAARSAPNGVLRLEVGVAEPAVEPVEPAVGPRGLHARADEDAVGDAALAACVVQALGRLPRADVPAGVQSVELSFEAGRDFVRPCVLEEHPNRRRVAIERVTVDASQAWDLDGTEPDLHVFLYYQGLQVTSVTTRDTADLDLAADPRAALRCPIAVSSERPLGVVVIDFDDGQDQVVGFGQTGDLTDLTRVDIGPGEVLVRRLPE